MLQYKHGGDIYTHDNICLDFSVNTNPLGIPATAYQALIKHIPECEHYPDPFCRKLRSELAARHGLDMAMILNGNGASELIFAICAAIKPRHTLVLAPTFTEYEQAATLWGGRVSSHYLKEEENFTLTESFLFKLTPDINMIFLCNPNNPTGQLANPALLYKIADKCRHNGILLVLDECFIDFTFQESLLAELEKYPNLLILQAFTKIYALAGLRLGSLFCADTRLLSNIAKYLPPWSVSTMAQIAGLAALQEEHWLSRTQAVTACERNFMESALTRLGFKVYKSDANYLLIKSSAILHDALIKRGILVRSCADFTGLDEHYIRIGLKTRDKNLLLLNAISEVLHG